MGAIQLMKLRVDQAEIVRHPARTKVLANGRRWGKTVLGGVLGVGLAARGRTVAWVAPTYKNTRPLWRMVESSTAAVRDMVQVSQAERVATFPGGGWLGVYTAESDVGLRGEAFDLVIVDEAARIKEETYQDVLVPTLADRDGRMLLISTPNSLNWFYREWMKGQDGPANMVASWKAPTSDNPIPSIQRAAELARTMLPDRTYQQEWLAEFVTDQGAVFRRVRDTCTGEPEGPREGAAYVVGVDWGKVNDYSVFAVWDVEKRRQVRLDRSNRVDYVLQVGRLVSLCEQYRPVQVVAEQNSIGAAVIEQLWRAGVRVHGWVATNATKAQVIEELALAMEKGEITLLRDAALIGELTAFEATRTPTGMTRYAAPEGMHDDLVIATAIAHAAGSRPVQEVRRREFRVEA